MKCPLKIEKLQIIIYATKMLIPLFTISQEMTSLNHKISMLFSPNIHTFLPGSELNNCCSSDSNVSHFTALKAGDILSKSILETKVFILAISPSERQRAIA